MDQQQWQEYLISQGAQWSEGAASFPDNSAHADLQLIDLSPLGAISVSGPDSQKFLQGQLTCDLINLPDEHLTLGGHCNPKGRMISAFHILKVSQSEFLLLLPRDLTPIALAALKKYAVFFKTELKSLEGVFRWLGLCGHDAGTRASHLLNLSHNSKGDLIPGQLIPFDHNGTRAIAGMLQERMVAVLVAEEQAADLWQQLTRTPATPASYNHWQQQWIAAGVPELHAATSEMFIPQMLNLHLLGAVSFKKGCYTGQEVVARMQYLGAAKRRMYLASVDGVELPEPGVEIFTPNGSSSVGNLVSACKTENGIELLAVLTKSKVVDNALMQLQDGRQLSLYELPYDADADPLA
ncbi:YgfZ/GcvT domain-containing protein [Microbulbifer aggregans]|uniref:CAF17-like 4Fe-4S cluster assembly/insertion protein YgfZ n=1 Tax=Microbulbifer aggregans TaxID=1769779 RepID=UPI001CFC56DC|nr:folate-binding protein YgfZ [Microbulbifer aggregans]